jgi:uncharacterized protein YndB with AHSA1/START domain
VSRQDVIVRRVKVRAPIDRVWGAITRADELAQWFGDSAEVDLRVGGSITFGWSEYGVTTIGVIEQVDEPYAFAFRWQASASVDDDPRSTLVTITLSEAGGATDVTVEESGLAALPRDVYDRTLEENSSGWTAELADLISHVGGRS